MSLLKSDTITSAISNFESLNNSGNLLRVSSMLERLVVSIVFVKAEGSGNTFEIDLASEPGRSLIKTKSNMVALNSLFKGI